MNFEYELKDCEELSLGIKIKPNLLIKGEYSLLEICLTEDVKDYGDILVWLDDVLNGNVEKDHCGGNVTIAEFDKEQTEIVIGITETPEKCTLPTWLFREIVEEWIKVYKKHFEETHKD